MNMQVSNHVITFSGFFPCFFVSSKTLSYVKKINISIIIVLLE